MSTRFLSLDLALRRRLLIAYSAGMALYTLVVVVLYPQFKNTTSLDALTRGNSAAAALFGLTGSLTSPSGWLNANIYANFLPLILLLLTIGYGASAVAGQDEDGTLALLAVLPVPRKALILQKAAALAVQTVIFSAVVCAFTLVGRSFQIAIPPSRIVATAGTACLLGVDFGLLALSLGAATGRKGLSIGITTATAAASYLLSSLAPVIHWLQPARYLSLLYWSIGDSQLAKGPTVADFLVLAAVGIALLWTSVAAFQRLDLH